MALFYLVFDEKTIFNWVTDDLMGCTIIGIVDFVYLIMSSLRDYLKILVAKLFVYLSISSQQFCLVMCNSWAKLFCIFGDDKCITNDGQFKGTSDQTKDLNVFA